MLSCASVAFKHRPKKNQEQSMESYQAFLVITIQAHEHV